MERIGLLTGTFDPIHRGHVELARESLRAAGLDAVWLLVNPHSSDHHSFKTAANLHDRVAMAGLAVADDGNIEVYAGRFADSPHKMETFNSIAAQYPDNEFVFVTGMDTIARLDRWDDVESVVKTASFAVAQRPGISQDTLGALRTRLGRLGGMLRVYVFDFDNHGSASSTDIRDQVRAGVKPEAVDDKVYEYIRSHKLYS